MAPTGTMKNALSAPTAVAMMRTRRTGAVNASHPTIRWPIVDEMTRTGSSGPSGTPAMSVIWRRRRRRRRRGSEDVDATGSQRGRIRLSRRRQRQGRRARTMDMTNMETAHCQGMCGSSLWMWRSRSGMTPTQLGGMTAVATAKKARMMGVVKTMNVHPGTDAGMLWVWRACARPYRGTRARGMSGRTVGPVRVLCRVGVPRGSG